MNLQKLILVLAAAGILLSPGCSLKSRIKKADKTYEQGEYFNASNLYKRVYGQVSYSQKPLKSRLAFNQAECYRLLNSPRAEMAYQNAIRNLYQDSIVYLRYAQVLQRNGKYGDAARNYSLYLKYDSKNEEALNGLEACQKIGEWKKNTTRYRVARFDAFNVRTASTFCPAFSAGDADVVFLSSSRQFNTKTRLKTNSITGQPGNNIFVARKDAKGKWEKPEIIGSDINTVENDEGVCSFSPDGKIMYFTRARRASTGQIGTEIYYSNRAGATWSDPKKIDIFKDTTISVAHPAMSPDGITLYFTSDAPNGLGGKDIWKATMQDGACKYVENAGPSINTAGDEMFPSFRADGTLFFSSNGRPGYGGLDIFRANLLKDGGWTVENMGEPINSNADDFSMCFSGKSDKGFFSSTRGDSKGYDQIWSFELPELAYAVEGKVTDEKGNPIADATIKLVSNTGVNARVLTRKDGTYRLKLDKDMECVMLATARGYLNQQNKVNTLGLTDSKSFQLNFSLSPVSKPVKMDNIFYEFGKWELTSASVTGLQSLVKLLKDNPNITIELSANTDFVGDNDANKLLSEKRAKAVVDYLIKAGVAADRLTPVGNGEEKPVVVDADMARKYPFLKLNQELNEHFVSGLTPEQQEVANQINRRTEFRVLKTTYKLY